VYDAEIAKSFNPPLVDQSVREPKVGGYVRLTAAQMKCEGGTGTAVLGTSKDQKIKPGYTQPDWQKNPNILFVQAKSPPVAYAVPWATIAMCAGVWALGKSYLLQLRDAYYMNAPPAAPPPHCLHCTVCVVLF
jgi:hypothetical protein